MILLTKLNGVVFVLNSDLIETMEENPDTTIRLISKTLIIVKESMQEVIQKIIEYKRATASIIDRINVNNEMSKYIQEGDNV